MVNHHGCLLSPAHIGLNPMSGPPPHRLIAAATTVFIFTLRTWDVVNLATAFVLQSVAAAAAAAASTAATVFGTSHPHEAAGHGKLGGLGKVGQDASRRVGQTSLEGGLRLGSLNTAQTPDKLHR